MNISPEAEFGIVNIYRNPAGLHLDLRARATQLRAEIVDLHGRVLHVLPFSNQGHTAIFQPQLARGIYLLRLTDGTHSGVRRFFW